MDIVNELREDIGYDRRQIVIMPDELKTFVSHILVSLQRLRFRIELESNFQNIGACFFFKY